MKAKSEKQFNKVESSEIDQSSLGLSTLDFKLKIGYDGKRAANNLTGLGNYSRSLISHLAEKFSANEYLVYSPKIKSKIENFFYQKLDFETFIYSYNFVNLDHNIF